MSGIDLNNPKVLQNFIRTQVTEGKGEYEVREEVVIFKSENGSEFIVPGDLGEETMAKIKTKAKKVKKEDTKKTDVKEAKKEETKK